MWARVDRRLRVAACILAVAFVAVLTLATGCADTVIPHTVQVRDALAIDVNGSWGVAAS